MHRSANRYATAHTHIETLLCGLQVDCGQSYRHRTAQETRTVLRSHSLATAAHTQKADSEILFTQAGLQDANNIIFAHLSISYQDDGSVEAGQILKRVPPFGKEPGCPSLNTSHHTAHSCECGWHIACECVFHTFLDQSEALTFIVLALTFTVIGASESSKTPHHADCDMSRETRAMSHFLRDTRECSCS